MATNFADETLDARIARGTVRLSFEHRFFLTVAVLFPVITVIGFAPSYYFKAAFNTPPVPSLLVHVHAMAMSLWIVLFSVQAYLISAKRIRLHMSLGMASIALVAVMVPTGIMTGIAAAKRGSAFPGYTPLEFFIVPVGDMIVFAVLFAAAVYFRKRAAEHKRLMLVTVVMFLGPSIGRLPLPFIPTLGAIWFFGVPAMIGIILFVLDTYRNGRMNKVFAAAMAFAVVSGPVRLLIARTDTWTQFAAYLTGYSG